MALNPCLFVLQNGKLFRMDLGGLPEASLTHSTVVASELGGVSFLASSGGRVYATKPSPTSRHIFNLIRIDGESGAQTVLELYQINTDGQRESWPNQWTQLHGMTAYGNSILIVHDTEILEVMPDGRVLSHSPGDRDYSGTTAMASAGPPRVYLTRSSPAGLFRGTYGAGAPDLDPVGGAEWAGTRTMCFLGDRLYLINQGSLHVIESPDRSNNPPSRTLGAPEWDGPVHMAAT